MQNAQEQRGLTVGRVVKFGGGTKEELIEELAQAGIQLNEYAKQLLTSEELSIPLEEQSLTVIEVSVADLGFSDGATTAEIIEGAAQKELTLCPLELAPHLRLQYPDQPEGPMVTTASERPGGGLPNGFYLQRRPDGLWLRGYRAEPSYTWEPGSRLVFCVNK